MHPARLGVVSDEVYFSSMNSPLTRVRYYCWISLVLVMGLLFVFELEASGASQILFYVLLIFLVTGFCMEWFFLRQLRPGRPLVTLSDEDITAPNLIGSSQQLRWREIEAISLETVKGRNLLIFLLNPSSGGENKGSFRTRAKQNRSVLSLSPFSPATKAKLLDAINRRHAQAQGRTLEKARLSVARDGASSANSRNN